MLLISFQSDVEQETAKEDAPVSPVAPTGKQYPMVFMDVYTTNLRECINQITNILHCGIVGHLNFYLTYM